MTTTPGQATVPFENHPGTAPGDICRHLVAHLAAQAAARDPRLVEPPLAALAPWLDALPPAVRRGVVADVARAAALDDADHQARALGAALTHARRLAARFTR